MLNVYVPFSYIYQSVEWVSRVLPDTLGRLGIIPTPSFPRQITT
jgi:hypothetical protein